MTLRTAKVLLAFGVALFYLFVVPNNTTDRDSNYQFVRRVMIDSTFPGNRGMWRATNAPAAHRVLFVDHRLGNARRVVALSP
jgi:predicted small integral membrane protein